MSYKLTEFSPSADQLRKSRLVLSSYLYKHYNATLLFGFPYNVHLTKCTILANLLHCGISRVQMLEYYNPHYCYIIGAWWYEMKNLDQKIWVRFPAEAVKLESACSLKSSDTKMHQGGSCAPTLMDLHVTFAVHPIASNGWGGHHHHSVQFKLWSWK